MSLSRFVMVLVLLANCLAAVSALDAGEPNQQRPQRMCRITVRAQNPTAGTETEESPVAESSSAFQDAFDAGTVYYTNDYGYEEEKGSIVLFLSRAHRRVYDSLSKTERILSQTHRRIYDLLEKKKRKHRKAFFLHVQEYHKQLLNPVSSPLCTANFGYHQTCWRRFPEIYDACPPAVPVGEPLSSEAIPPAPKEEPHGGAESSSAPQSPESFNALSTDFDVRPSSDPGELKSIFDLTRAIDAERAGSDAE